MSAEKILLVSRTGVRLSVPALPLLAVSSLARQLVKEDSSIFAQSSVVISIPVETTVLEAFLEILTFGKINKRNKDDLEEAFSLLKVDVELSIIVKRANSTIKASGIGFISSVYSLTSMENENDDEILNSIDSERNAETLKVFICKTCSDEFKDKMEFISHANLVHNKILLPCSQCAAVLSKDGLRKHLKRVHIKMQHSCDQCSFKTSRKVWLKKHKEMKHKHLVISCSQCDEKFSCYESLSKHIQVVHVGLSYARKKNENIFLNKILKKRVHAGHQESEKLRFSCNWDGCNKTMRSEASVKRHEQADHYGIRYNCDVCGSSFTQACNLKRHRDKIHGNNYG